MVLPPIVTKQMIRRCFGWTYVGSGPDAYAVVPKPGWRDLVFTSDLLATLLSPAEQEKLPPDARFCRCYIQGVPFTVLRLPAKVALRFCWKLNRRLTRREYGPDPRRRLALAQQRFYHTSADLAVLWHLQQGRCYYTGRSLGDSFETASFDVDHIVPLADGGHDGPLNLALVSPVVNGSKGVRSLAGFLRRLRPSRTQRGRMRAVNAARRAFFREIDRRKPDWAPPDDT